MLKYLLMLYCLLIAQSAWALDVKQHADITRSAVAMYKTCQGFFPDLLHDMTGDDERIIVHASRDIDKMSLLHPARSLSRVWNWHFYDASLCDVDHPQTSIHPNFWGMNGSLHRTFVQRVITLQQYDDGFGDQSDDRHNERFYRLSGEVLHFIQDMGVPSHVVPIFHGGSIKDAFDHYEWDQVNSNPIQANQTARAHCAQLIAQHRSPEVILIKLAGQTRKAIKQKISNDGSRTWALFWSMDAKDKDPSMPGFYHYGQCGNSFGDTDTARPCNVSGNIFKRFYKARYQQMMSASVQALITINLK